MGGSRETEGFTRSVPSRAGWDRSRGLGVGFDVRPFCEAGEIKPAHVWFQTRLSASFMDL
jgi:hypothetical protein